ncbi:hypothetical protein [Gorillibacterium sp. sgz5001074]|uniref:hypothetical protein n=1 Tax=Gorillibacterium sp. sgz5001074 TaxID=3446695 RepID=UPI003F670BAC
MEVTLQTTSAPDIDWGATGAAEIVQNVRTLISTFKYEVAYDRTLGIRPDFLDMPQQLAVTRAVAEIYAVVEEREPRARLKDVSFDGVDEDGTMNFKVVMEV